MKNQEKQKMLHVLRGVDILTSESKKPTTITQLLDLIPEIPAPTVYSHVDRACKYGLLEKGIGKGRKSVSITLAGYRFLEKEAPVQAEPTNNSQLSLELAFGILSNMFLNSDSLDRAQREALLESIKSLM